MIKVEVHTEEIEDREIEEEKSMLKSMMNNEYIDEEIDKLIETFAMLGLQGK